MVVFLKSGKCLCARIIKSASCFFWIFLKAKLDSLFRFSIDILRRQGRGVNVL